MSFSQKQHKDNLEKWSASKYALFAEPEIAYFKIMGEDLNGAYTCLRHKQGDSTAERELIDPDTVWDFTSVTSKPTGITLQGGKRELLYTKKAIKNPKMVAKIPTYPDETEGFFGFEPQRNTPSGYVAFRFDPITPSYKIQVHSPNGADPGVVSLDISSFLPTDHQSSSYVYGIEVTDNAAWFYVQKKLVGVILHGLEQSTPSYGPDPYWVAGSGVNLAKRMMHFIEWGNHSSVEKKWGITKNLEVLQGQSMYGKSLPLYDYEASTLLTSGTYASGASHKSHPIPIHGYNNKTLLFRADTASVTDGLQIEVLTQEGNWRTYDTITTSANSLESYIVSGNFPLMRIGYEPSADGASITDAEMELQ